MKKVTAALAVLLALTLTGCGDDASTTSGQSTERVAPSSEETTAPIEETATPEPLVAQSPVAAGADAFLEFVRGRLATFPSQIPDATDEQLIAAGNDACERVESGESVDKMSVIEDEKPSEVGGYFFDSNAIIAGALMHLCPEN